MANKDLEPLADGVADLILSAGRIVVFTGAGISTESGIPDFRSPGGIWDRFDPEDFTYRKFISDPDSRKKQWQLLWGGDLTETAEPNPAWPAALIRAKAGETMTEVIQKLTRKMAS